MAYDTVGAPEENLWVMNRDGSGHHRLNATRAKDRAPGWSRDGNFIYASRESGTAYAIPAHKGLIRNPELLELGLRAAQSIFNRESPDGAFLVLSGFDLGSPVTLYSRAKNNAEKIGESGGRAVWLTNSSGFLYAQEGKCQYYDLRTRTRHTLFNVAPARIKDIDIADGKVYFTRAVRDGDLWIGSMAAH